MKRTVGQVHLCRWPDCRRPIPISMWGCKSHWFTLPQEIRDAIWAGYRLGKLSPEWIAADQRALEWIKGIPERTQHTHDVTPLPKEN
jgi:hypothetical protein